MNRRGLPLRICAGLIGLGLVGCSGEKEPATTVFHEEGRPEKLSDWGALASDGKTLSLASDATPYDLATPLFTDYAQKLRTVSLPAGEAANYNAETVFDFPVGTVITKTFYYSAEQEGIVNAAAAPVADNGALKLEGLRLMETRLLARRSQGWVALPYVWNDDQTEATLKRTGEIIPLTLVREDGRREDFSYLVPNQNQCAGCHATNNTTREIAPIGPKARHLNKVSTFQKAFNQLDWWMANGLLNVDEAQAASAPANADWSDASFSLDQRARAYLDANCGHCHNKVGPADTSGLDLEPGASGPALGTCKSPIAAGDGSGGRLFDIVPGEPDASILVFRMETTNPAAMMPELGRSVAHEEGVALLRDWIASMPGECS